MYLFHFHSHESANSTENYGRRCLTPLSPHQYLTIADSMRLMNFKQCCWCVVDILCLTFDPHNDWAHSSLFLAAAEKASWRKYMIRLHAWYRVVFPSCCTGYDILLWPKSSHIFISGQIQPWSNFATRYEAGFKHILVVWPNCLIISRIRIFSNSHTLLLSRSLLLSFHKLNLILPTGHNNVITVLWLIHWLWWTTWCLVVYSVFFIFHCWLYVMCSSNNIRRPRSWPDLQSKSSPSWIWRNEIRCNPSCCFPLREIELYWCCIITSVFCLLYTSPSPRD